MKKLLISLVLLTGVFGPAGAVLRACGAKFLVSSKSARYQRLVASIKPARILVYWQQDESTKEEDRWNPDASELLENAGHSVEVAFDSEALLRAAGQDSYDVVILQLRDAKEFDVKIRSLAPSAALLPVLAFPSGREFSEAKQEFGTVLRFPATLNQVLKAVEKARKAGPKS